MKSKTKELPRQEVILIRDKTRSEIIDALVCLDIDNWNAEATDAVCRNGCIGYNNMEDDDLVDLYCELYDICE